MQFRVIAGSYQVTRLPASAAPLRPSTGFWCELRQADWLTVYALDGSVDAGVEARTETGWALLELVGSFDFAVVGVMARWTHPLAMAGIPIMALSSFDTDYLFLKHQQLPQALAALELAGFQLLG